MDDFPERARYALQRRILMARTVAEAADTAQGDIDHYCEALAPSLRLEGYTYALVDRASLAGPYPLVKVGHSVRQDLSMRVRDVELMNAGQLVLGGIAHGAVFEQLLKKMLEPYRSHGEWFCTPCPIWLPDPSDVEGLCWGCSFRQRVIGGEDFAIVLASMIEWGEG